MLPPITGVFAIAFEVELGKGTVKYEVSNLSDYNVASVPNGDQVYSLVYQNATLVTFIPHNAAFKVSFENAGSVARNKVRGFLVIETTVGTLTQKLTRVALPQTNPPIWIDIPEGSDVNKVDQRVERLAFEKVEGHYMFTVTCSPVQPAQL